MPFSWSRVLAAVLAAVVIIGAVFVGLIAYANAYTDRVLPGVRVGNMSVGGMRRDNLVALFERMSDKLVAEGMTFSFENETGRDTFALSPVVVAEDGSSYELIHFDSQAAAEILLSFGKNIDPVSGALFTLLSAMRTPRLSLASAVTYDKNRMIAAISDRVSRHESEPRDASVTITSITPLAYDVTTSSRGIVFLYDDVVGQAVSRWASLEPVSLELKRIVKEPRVRLADVEPILARLPNIIAGGPLELKHTDPHTKKTFSRTLSVDDLAANITVQKTADNGFGFGLDETWLTSFLEENVATNVNVEAKDAKFEIGDNGKVVEFQGSRPGVTLDIQKTSGLINDAFLQRTWHDEGVAKEVTLAVDQIEPNVKTGEVNDLGIQEMLGTGISDYSRSPRNRILNIKNAVNKLNGILIKPGEEFSALKYLAPFTYGGGYLPELVIKGDEIKPEIGGGLCQIGTTLFRMAMMSGMPITARRNHSLVVFHYNDPVNGNPGTDATIYDPNPDFRFANDTGNYLLLQAYMNTETEELEFTLWGTSDGRKGYYDHPTVTSWIGAGAPKEVETTDLSPGERKCQKAFRGANAFFTYTRELPDGTKEERVFESHYRPLPQICLVGVEKKAEGSGTEEAGATQPVDAGVAE